MFWCGVIRKARRRKSVVRGSADATGTASTEVLGSVTDLTRQGEALRHEVQGFLAAIKTG